jgi:hypothetical protein
METLLKVWSFGWQKYTMSYYNVLDGIIVTANLVNMRGFIYFFLIILPRRIRKILILGSMLAALCHSYA